MSLSRMTFFTITCTSIILLCYSQLVISKFGRLDDFAFYLWSRNDAWEIIKSGLTYGRPLLSLILGLSFTEVNSIEGFSIMRAISVLILLATILILYIHYSKKLKINTPVFFSVTFLLLSLPGVWVFLSWAQGLPHFVGLLLVAIAVNCYESKKIVFYVSSLLAIYTYQPFGLILPTLLTIEIMHKKDRAFFREFTKFISWIIFATFSNLVVVHIQPNYNRRANFTTSYSEKLSWVYSEWIPRVVFPWSFKPWMFLTFLIVSIYIILLILCAKYFNYPKILALVFATTFTSVPFVISVDNWASSRAVLSSNIVFYVAICYLASQVSLFKKTKKLNVTALFLMCLMFFLYSTKVANETLVYPQSFEWKRSVQEIRNIPNEAKIIEVQLAPFEQTSAPFTAYDENGILNSSVEIPLKGMVALAQDSLDKKSLEIQFNSIRQCQSPSSFLDLNSGVYKINILKGVKSCG